MSEKEIICIVCPKGCHIQVTVDTAGITCKNYGCPRGKEYAIQEATMPKRMLTGTVKINNAIHPRLPVMSDQPVAKEKLREMMDELDKITVEAPITVNQLIISNILDSGVNIVASRTMEVYHD